MTPHVLTALGRTHDPANVATAVREARDAGFESFNLDLIYGGVGESLDDWKRTLADCARARAPARECVCPHGRTGYAARRDS